MSQENVEIVRAAINAYNRGDWDAVLKNAAPDFEYDLSRRSARSAACTGASRCSGC
jgi:ketosteroid isomerase-like protein